MDLTYRPVDTNTWDDLEKFFEAKGGPHFCWCMVWRPMAQELSRSKKADKKAALKSSVDCGEPVGILAYSDSEPVAWCSIAPRSSYRDLSGDPSLDGVWSLVCFFIKRAYRGRGLTAKLIEAAVNYARENGARYVEAYPVTPDSPSYRFMGYTRTFQRLGFELRGKAGLRRNVMTLKL